MKKKKKRKNPWYKICMDHHLYTLVLRFLTIRSRSEKEVTDYLQKKKASEEQIRLILSKLREQKFVNDEKFAQAWIEQRMRLKPKGWYVLKLELQQKGIADDIIARCELHMKTRGFEGKSEKELAMELVQKRIKKYQGLPREEVYRKLGGFLARRGFAIDTIKACIDGILKK